MNKVLIITYYWPPSGGAGVQRWLKFSKYLPQFGWEPVILTVDPQFAAYPVNDKSFSDEMLSSLKVNKTPATDYFTIYKKDKSKIPTAGFANSIDDSIKGKILRFIRGNFFIPDPRKGWNRYAFSKACEIIKTEGIKQIITTSPPHSSQLIGLKLKRNFPQIKWIADLRDPWTEIYYYDQFYPTFISKWIDRAYEKRVLQNSDRIITIGNSLKTSFSLLVKGISEKTVVISNGFDAEDFAGINPASPEVFTVSYIGTLSDIYPIDGFLDALTLVRKNGNKVNLRFVGTVSQKQKEVILKKSGDSAVEFVNYVDHESAIKFLMGSSALLLIIPDHKSNRSIITGKLFEYIASCKPVICLGPVDGDAADILKETGHGNTFLYNDEEGISSCLKELISDNSIKEKSPAEIFSRVRLTKKVADVLDDTLKIKS